MTDTELIKQCQSGDSNAFESLLERHYDTIYRFAYQWCRNRENAQDITQIVCMKLSKSIMQFEFKSTFTSWLFPIVINSAKDFYKSPSSHNTREESFDTEAQDSKANEQNLSRDKVRSHPDTNAQIYYSRQILQTINKMPNDLKETLLLVHTSNVNHKQASEILGIKESTVSWRIHEARKILKKTFASSNLLTQESNVETGASI